MERIKIDKGNYFDALPETLRKSHEFVVKVTGSGEDWSKYEGNDTIKKTIDLYFEKLSDFAGQKVQSVPVQKVAKEVHKKEKAEAKPKHKTKSAKDIAKELIRPYVLRGDSLQEIKAGQLGVSNGAFSARIKGSKIYVDEIKGVKADASFSLDSIYNEIQKESGKTSTKDEHVQFVESFDEDIKQVKKFAALNDRVKDQNQILNILKGLQRAITGKLISKAKSRFIKEIDRIQNMLIKLVDVVDGKRPIEIDPKFLSQLVQIAGGEKIYYSITLIRSYIGMQGKELDREKTDAFIKRAEKALESGRVGKDDPYLYRLKSIISSLKKRQGKEPVAVSKAELNGLKGIIEACGCGFNGIDQEKPSGIVNSMDFAKMKFDTLGFKGKWKEFIGDPPRKFRAMIFGYPKFGKSYLAIDWALYLAANHGKTLYVTKEESLYKTFQIKIHDKGAEHPNLDLTDNLPDDLSDYQFVFLDSVSRLGLSPKELNELNENYPNTSFIEVHQVTKGGAFRGSMQYEHNVDIVIEVPEKGFATQKGRFNDGGEMKIFDEDQNYRMAA